MSFQHWCGPAGATLLERARRSLLRNLQNCAEDHATLRLRYELACESCATEKARSSGASMNPLAKGRRIRSLPVVDASIWLGLERSTRPFLDPSCCPQGAAHFRQLRTSAGIRFRLFCNRSRVEVGGSRPAAAPILCLGGNRELHEGGQSRRGLGTASAAVLDFGPLQTWGSRQCARTRPHGS